MAMQKTIMLHGVAEIPAAYIKLERSVYDSALSRVLLQFDVYGSLQQRAEGKGPLDSYLVVANEVDPAVAGFNTLQWAYAIGKEDARMAGATDILEEGQQA